MAVTYKYSSGLTSQLAFCAVPLRFDPYNNCSFGCDYCFASTRQGHGRRQPLKVASLKALDARLSRVEFGIINSAEDEFIARRIPFQIGGMADPFSSIDRKYNQTIEALKIFRKFYYPIIISTKSLSVSSPKVLSILKESNVYVRISTTVIAENLRQKVDRGAPSFEESCLSATRLSEAGVPVSFRFQPIIPKYEDEADKMLSMAAESGVSHISGEYLKVPIDANRNFGSTLKKLMEGEPVQYFISMGALRHGREYILPFDYRKRNLDEIRNKTNKLGMTFGYADNDLMLLSDGSSCCGAADLYLKEANFFDSNFPSLFKTKEKGQYVFFNDLLNTWIPQKNIETYLNSKARINFECYGQKRWESHLRKMWLGKHGLYKPSFFFGIEKTQYFDKEDMPIYMRT